MITTPSNACPEGVYWGCNNMQPEDRCEICAPRYENPILTIDVVCFTLINGSLHVLLMKREREPFKNQLALPGGYIHINEDKNTLDAARRVAKDKLGIDVPYLEQLGTFSGIERDPRGWSASVVYIAVVQPSKVKETTEFFPIDNGWKRIMTQLAFDHDIILNYAVKRIRDKSTYSSLPLFLMNDTFTLTALQEVYECMMQTEIDKGTFRRKILEQEIVEPTGEILESKTHRPARLYKPTEATLKLFKDVIT